MVTDKLAFSTDTNKWRAVYDPLNVRDFGAVGDGVADDTIPIRSAVTQGRTDNRPVFCPAGRYRLTGAITTSGQNGPLEIYGQGQQAWLLHDFAGAFAPSIFAHGGGTIGASQLITADILPGATTIQVVNVAALGLVRRDYITIRDQGNPHYGTSTDEVNGCEGEVLQVESVDTGTNTIILMNSLEEKYTRITGTVPGIATVWANNNVDVRKLNLVPGLYIHDLGFEDIGSDMKEGGTNSGRVLDLDCLLRFTARNTHTKNFDRDTYRLEYAVDFLIEDCIFEDGISETTYGLQVRAGCSGRFVRPIGRNIRHIMTTGNNAGDEIPPRHIDVIGGQCYGHIAASYDTHGNGKYIRFIDCADYSHRGSTITDWGDASFQVRCKKSSVINPIITGSGHHVGVAAQSGATDFTLIGGEIRGCDTGVLIHGCDNASVSGTRIWPKAGANAGIQVERVVGYNVPMVANHISNVQITGDPAAPATYGINYISASWVTGWTMDVDLMRIKNCTQSVMGSSLGITINVDSVYSVALGATKETVGLLMIWCTTNIGFPPSPNGILRFRTGPSATLSTISLVNTTNIVVTTGVLTGTTGIAGNFTMSAATDGKLYFENRGVGSKVIGIKLIGPA